MRIIDGGDSWHRVEGEGGKHRANVGRMLVSLNGTGKGQVNCIDSSSVYRIWTPCA
jgi:hypothetical protein